MYVDACTSQPPHLWRSASRPHNPSLEHSPHAQPEGRWEQDRSRRRAWCLHAACPKPTLHGRLHTLSVSPSLFSSTDHDDALTQARGGDPPSPVGRLPRDAERGEWRGTYAVCVLGARTSGVQVSGAAYGVMARVCVWGVGDARGYVGAHLVFVLSWGIHVSCSARAPAAPNTSAGTTPDPVTETGYTSLTHTHLILLSPFSPPPPSSVLPCPCTGPHSE